MLTHRKCDNVQSVEKAAEIKKQSADLKHLEKSSTDMEDLLEKLLEARVKNITNCEKSIAYIKSEVSRVFDSFVKHIHVLKDQTLQDIAATEKDILPNLATDRDELKCKISAIQNGLQLLRTNTKRASPVEYLQAVSKLSEQSQFLNKYVKEKTRSVENLRITFEQNEKLSELEKTVTTFGKISVHKEASAGDSAKKPTVDLLKASPKLVLDIPSSYEITGATFLNDGRILIGKHGTQAIALLDTNGTELSSTGLPGNPFGIKMTSDTEGAVAIQNKAILFFNINGSKIVTGKKIDVAVIYDFSFHAGTSRYYIGSENKIIVQESSHKHVRDISVNGRVAHIVFRAENTLCYSTANGRVLHCITLDGEPLFQYSHDKLQNTWGVAVDIADNVYVCCYNTKTIHQVNSDGKLHRIIVENLPASPFYISFTKDCDKIVLGCYHKVLTYTFL